jgi:hypothetical protein
MDWQPIETAPKDGTVIDVWLGDADAPEVDFYCTFGTRRSAGWQWRQGKFRPVHGMHVPVVGVQPTHWMPLPEAPDDPPQTGESRCPDDPRSRPRRRPRPARRDGGDDGGEGG